MDNFNFANRLSLALKNSDYQTKAEIAEKAGITPQYLNKILAAKSKSLPAADVALHLADALHVDAVWLISGKGEMTKTNNVKIAEDDSDCIGVQSYNISLSCGGGCFEPEYELLNTESPVYFKKNWFDKHMVAPEDCRRLRARGDSMVPVIMDGDYVTVDCSLNARTHIENNKIYAIVNDGLLCCKYLIKLIDGGLLIKSANQSYIDERLSAVDAGQKIIIIGKVLDRSGDIS